MLHTSYRTYIHNRFIKGFTLIELLVVIAILGILMISVALVINPSKQLSKADDSRRHQDVQQIKNALALYYNDYNCYPASIPFGSEWREGNTVYMAEVPQDPACTSDSSTCYRYTTSGSCPQWNIVFVKLSSNPLEKDFATSCPLTVTDNCQPQGHTAQWSCSITGSPDCNYLQDDYSLDEAPTSDTTPTPTSGPIPTPTTDPCPPEERNYSCTGSPALCNVVPQGLGTYCSSACGGAC